MYVHMYTCTSVYTIICLYANIFHMELRVLLPSLSKKSIHIKPYLLLYSACNLKGAFGPCQWQICGSWSGAWKQWEFYRQVTILQKKEVYTVDTCIYMYHKHARTHTHTLLRYLILHTHTHIYIYTYMHSNRYHNFKHGWYVLPCACWTGRKTFYRFDLRPGSHNDHEGWRDCLTKLCSKYLGPESPQPKEVQRVIQCRGWSHWSIPCLDTSWHTLTHLDRSWRILTHLDASWQILTHLDTPWRILTDLDESGQILTDLARPWQVLTDFDRSWQILTHLDRLWHILTGRDTS